ncbi:MAG TPA: glucosylceramidase, partial [Chryseosolibacter sp.]|nr:glucosylceramidase [Chryseosolibacter sp.]
MSRVFLRSRGFRVFVLVGVIGTVLSCSSPKENVETPASGDVEFWLTTGDKQSLLEKSMLAFSNDEASGNVIIVDTAQQFQGIDGFGYALTGGSAMLMNTKLNAQKRAELLKELF